MDSSLESIDCAVKRAVFELVSVAFLFHSIDRDDDSMFALEFARDVSGLLQPTKVEPLASGS